MNKKDPSPVHSETILIRRAITDVSQYLFIEYDDDSEVIYTIQKHESPWRTYNASYQVQYLQHIAIMEVVI